MAESTLANDVVASKAEREGLAFRRLLPQLLARPEYLDRFVAIHDEKVVDHDLPVYLVEIRVGTLDPVLARVALGPSEPHILLGRDVINRHDLMLRGVQRALEISVAADP